jgi:hypothetical protein
MMDISWEAVFLLELVLFGLIIISCFMSRDNGTRDAKVAEADPLALIYRACKKENWRCYGLPGGKDNRIPIYGEITQGDFAKIIDCCIYLFGMDESFRVLDIGSGVGKPSWHFAQSRIDASVGIESEYERFISSIVVQQSIDKLSSPAVCDRVSFLHADILQVSTLSDFDLVYTFDCGIPDDVYEHIASIVGGRMRYLVSYRPPEYLERFGFNLVLLGALGGLKLSGSTNSRTAFFYSVGPSTNFNPDLRDEALEAAIYMCHAPVERKRRIEEQMHMYLK